MIEVTAFTDKYKSLNDVVQEGLDSVLLRDNPIFQQAINEMYTKITLAEDKLIGEADLDCRELGAKIKHYAMLRTLLSDFVLTLDGFIQLGENAGFHRETTGE